MDRPTISELCIISANHSLTNSQMAEKSQWIQFRVEEYETKRNISGGGDTVAPTLTGLTVHEREDGTPPALLSVDD